MPQQRKHWAIRKLYGGKDGILPPTDPRFLALTEEQMDVDLMHYRLDNPEKFSETFSDAGFDDYEKETTGESSEVDSDVEKYIASEVIKKEKELSEAKAISSNEWEDIPDEDL